MEWLMPLHPKLVHFPIALLTAALVWEAVAVIGRRPQWGDGAVVLFAAAAFITPWVVRSGMSEAHRLGMKHPVLESHQFWAVALMWVLLAGVGILWLLRRSRLWRWVFRMFVAAAVMVVTIAAHYGGVMVYEYCAGSACF